MAANEEEARYGRGHARLVVRTASVEQVQAMVRLCAAQRIVLNAGCADDYPSLLEQQSEEPFGALIRVGLRGSYWRCQRSRAGSDELLAQVPDLNMPIKAPVWSAVQRLVQRPISGVDPPFECLPETQGERP